MVGHQTKSYQLDLVVIFGKSTAEWIGRDDSRQVTLEQVQKIAVIVGFLKNVLSITAPIVEVVILAGSVNLKAVSLWHTD